MIEQIVLKDGKARPPKLLRKVCIHNGNESLPIYIRGDMAFEIDIILGRREETYVCIQCGHTVSYKDMLLKYQAYMVSGTPIVLGRHIPRN